ncbi:phospholipase D/nuclease [Amanita muscaria]
MASFFKDLVEGGGENIVSLGKKVATHARNEVIGRWNPNRRHDSPEEKKVDEMRQQINDSHRFQSFAGERYHNVVKWHVDGHDYMWALSEMLENASEAIFIMDWWLSPELYLRRPPAHNAKWRLDRVLKRKADQGVKIHIIVYKEVSQTMSMNSSHTKHKLEDLSSNITVMRHPDHIGTKDDVEIWSHHEKVVVVDNHWAAIGGLDLCYGRWDSHNHPLADAHPTEFDRTLFPGQDYNNARIKDFKDVFNYTNPTISILESARMPWHDVHMTFMGPVVLDVVQHFVERWNEVKKRKYRTDDKFPWLALPHGVGVASEDEPVISHPHLQHWHEIGHKYKQRWIGQDEDTDDYIHPRVRGSCKVQVCRSVSDWSHGVLTEHSIQNAYIKLIQEAERFIYIENQFFISSTGDDGAVKNQIAKALVERILRAATQGSKFTVTVVIPELPGFAGDVKDTASLKFIMGAQYRTINRGGHSIYEELRKANLEPTDYIRFYHLRTYDRINAPMGTLIKQMEQNSGVTFLDAQVAMARQWIGDDTLTQQKEVDIILPQETQEAIVVEKTKTVKVAIPQSEAAASNVIARFERGAPREDADVSDSVSSHALLDTTSLLDEKWLGNEQEELNSYVSELLYIHSKLMIVDDRKVIMGSANLNDRSQKGDGDSEIALVVEDTAQIPSTMDGRPFAVSAFATTLRRFLFREHLGLIQPQRCDPYNQPVTANMKPAPYPYAYDFGSDEDNMVADPVSDSTRFLWQQVAKKNRDIFTEIFQPVPTNLVRDWEAYRRYVPKVKTGHVVPGVSLAKVKQRLSDVRGSLVECPLDFLIDEKELVSGPEWTALNPTLPIFI